MTNVSTRPRFGTPAFALLIVMLAISLLPVSAVHAGTGGNADISGSVSSSRIFYFTDRYINTPLSAGADIAAIKYSGPTNMKLGTHNCMGPLLGPSQTLSSSFYVGLVGDLTTYSGQKFCLFTDAGPGGSTGTFTGNLDWD